MSKIPHRNWIRKSALENFIQNSHWMFAFAPFLAFIASFFVETKYHLLEGGLMLMAIVINFLILWLRSLVEENKELSLFYTFRTNNLPPPKTGQQQRYKVDVAVVEDENSNFFYHSLYDLFKKEPILKDLSLEEVHDPRLRFTPVAVKAPTGIDEKQNTGEFLGALNSEACNSTAVLVVRAGKQLEEKDWLYKAVDEWAYEHSDVPILVVRTLTESYPQNDIADRYLWMPDEPKTLPWRLLQRARERALAWRAQASFNRAMVANIFFLVLMFVAIATYWLISQKQKHEIVMRGMYRAIETKEMFENDVLKGKGGNLHVSYFISRRGWPYVFVTTESGDQKNAFEREPSLISCGFENPGLMAEWNGGAPAARVFTSFGAKDPDHSCLMADRGSSDPISAIVCDSYRPSGATSADATVGICIFSERDNSILRPDYDYKTLLRKRTIAFSTEFGTLIDDGKLTTVQERKLWSR